MATYWLSFTLDDRTIGGRDYSTRWNALYSAIHQISGANYWEKTTSFILFSADKTIEQVVSTAKNAVSPTYDLVLIRSLDTQSARIFGPNADDDIFALMPYLQKA
ncbi:hypothetical protein [Phyllobacterium calauticae]|jgi:hypothetical protein|uniref:hypothetical protein n=1 Tax=Phyllobacterium calauticae TaxID=2817027 RepID=UPI001CC17B6A|nr:hypothetical protein [Phyllobacterium calauticae]MBZ3693255.1 hypothetical protein [Phyllobacterium calauticae]